MKPNSKESNHISIFITTLTSRLFVILLFSLPFFTMAQIQYVDIIPDTTITGDSSKYELDIDSDDLFEYSLSIEVENSFYPLIKMVSLLDSGFVSYHMVENCWMAWALELNDTVENTSFLFYQPPYYQIAYLGPSYCLHPGYFAGTVDKYIGMKWTKNGHTYFGWLRIDVAADASWFKLKDYAYAESGILAGQKAMSINENKAIASQVKTFYLQNEILIQADASLKITEANFLNCPGQMNHLQVTDNQVSISKSQFKPGVYLIRLNTSEGKYSIKILIN
jgi:hypothetical protein